MEFNSNCFFGQKDITPIYSQTSISFLKRCPGFLNAKSGDMKAAESVVNLCVKPWRNGELKKRYSCAVLLPLNGKNKLPQAYAEQIGLKIQNDVYLSQSYRTKNAYGAVALYKQFTCNIQKNAHYILVDDIISQNRVLAALRKYILSKGGFVCALAGLAYLGDTPEISARDIYKSVPSMRLPASGFY